MESETTTLQRTPDLGTADAGPNVSTTPGHEYRLLAQVPDLSSRLLAKTRPDESDDEDDGEQDVGAEHIAENAAGLDEKGGTAPPEKTKPKKTKSKRQTRWTEDFGSTRLILRRHVGNWPVSPKLVAVLAAFAAVVVLAIVLRREGAPEDPNRPYDTRDLDPLSADSSQHSGRSRLPGGNSPGGNSPGGEAPGGFSHATHFPTAQVPSGRRDLPGPPSAEVANDGTGGNVFPWRTQHSTPSWRQQRYPHTAGQATSWESSTRSSQPPDDGRSHEYRSARRGDTLSDAARSEAAAGPPRAAAELDGRIVSPKYRPPYERY